MVASFLSVDDMFDGLRKNYVVRNVHSGLAVFGRERATIVYSVFLGGVFLLALVGPMITPYQYDERVTDENDVIRFNEPPSLAHPLGTTDGGYDVLSRLIYGARPTAITGVVGGLLIISIGLTIGMTAGYVGGWVDDVLMRFTDFVLSVPLLPFAIVLLAFTELNLFASILVIGAILWRGNARVLRSQVLQIKNRPFILSAKSLGASSPRIMVKHILPNIASMAIMFFSFGIGYSILLQAGLAFLGLSNPFIPSWGVMIRNAYNSGYMSTAWWWSLPPGFLISCTVLSAVMLGRSLESVDESTDPAVQGG